MPHSVELKFQYCDMRYFTQAVVTDKFMVTKNYFGIYFDYRNIYFLNNVCTHARRYTIQVVIIFHLDCSFWFKNNISALNLAL